jgi:hypothetical protein
MAKPIHAHIPDLGEAVALPHVPMNVTSRHGQEDVIDQGLAEPLPRRPAFVIPNPCLDVRGATDCPEALVNLTAVADWIRDRPGTR